MYKFTRFKLHKYKLLETFCMLFLYFAHKVLLVISSNFLRFKEEVEDRIIMTSGNSLLISVLFGITEKLFELKYPIWLS